VSGKTCYTVVGPSSVVCFHLFGASHILLLLQATRYNYTAEEKSALVELIGMVKSVQSQLFHLEPLLTHGIYIFIYKELQDFMHCSLPAPLHKAEKRHKEIIKGYLYILTQFYYCISRSCL